MYNASGTVKVTISFHNVEMEDDSDREVIEKIFDGFEGEIISFDSDIDFEEITD